MSERAAVSPPVNLEREPVEGACPACGRTAMATYPVVSEGGWFVVVKCQECLHTLSRERWALLGPLQLLADQV